MAINLMEGHPGCKLRVEGVGPVLRAIADPTRRQILDLLASNDLPINRIADCFRVSRWAIMKHLRVLRSADLISVRRSGRERIQRLNTQPLRSAEAWISRFASLSDDSRQRHKTTLEADLTKKS